MVRIHVEPYLPHERPAKICKVCDQLMGSDEGVYVSGRRLAHRGVKVPADLAVDIVSYRCHIPCLQGIGESD